MENSIDFTIVIPVYNSADIFPELYRRIIGVLEGNVGNFEIITVLDGCRDRSFEVISECHRSDKRIKLIEFSRNFGHQAAISAGLEAAKGKLVAIMDDDLEDPPEVLIQLLKKLREGYDVVYGIRRKRKRFFLYRYLYLLFYRLLGRIVELNLPYDAGDFCLMSKQVVKTLNAMPERNRYLRGLRAWSGFRQTGVEYERAERYASRSGYSFKKYVSLALDAIFSFSYKPLKLVSISGMVIALGSFFFGVHLIYQKLTGGIPNVPGWASLAVSVLFLSGIQMVSIGIIGEYISRIYDEVKQRPQYVIKNTLGLEDSHS